MKAFLIDFPEIWPTSADTATSYWSPALNTTCLYLFSKTFFTYPGQSIATLWQTLLTCLNTHTQKKKHLSISPQKGLLDLALFRESTASTSQTLKAAVLPRKQISQKHSQNATFASRSDEGISLIRITFRHPSSRWRSSHLYKNF